MTHFIQPPKHIKRSTHRRGRPLFAGLTLASALAFAGSAFAGGPPEWVTGQILVKGRPGVAAAELEQLIERHGGKKLATLQGLDIHVVKVPARAEQQVARALGKNPKIDFAEPDMLVTPVETIPNDTLYSDGWHLPKINAPLAWDSSRGNGIVVAILDTGVDSSHIDLNGQLVAGRNVASDNNDTSDIHDHGTSVAGVVGAKSQNAEGVASVAWDVSLMPIRITNRSDGVASTSDIAKGLTWASDHGARVANISYAVTGSSTVLNAAKYMRDAGGIVVAAAGNSGNNPGYSDSPYVISVSATTSSDALAGWSSYGSFVDVSAPGASLITTRNGGGYYRVSGTSFSSPTTAGVVALILGANASLSPSEAESILEASATDLGASGWDQYYGNGRVDAAAAVSMALAGVPSDNQAPVASVTSPGGGSEVSGSVSITINASDNDMVAKVELYVDGSRVATDSNAPFSFSWDSTGHADGTAGIHAVATDASGNQGQSSVVNVNVSNASSTPPPPPIVDDVPPMVNITSPSSGATVSGTVNIQASTSDNEAIELVTVYVDDATLCVSSSTSVSCGWNTKKAGSGNHSIRVVARDTSGNTAEDNIAVSVISSSNGKSGGQNNKGRKK